MATEEVFGPALPIWRVRDLDEAIERANDSPFGLGSSVWTGDLRGARERAAAQLEAGYTWINSRDQGLRRAPVRRLKSSGYGKEHGSEAFDYYTGLQVGRRQTYAVGDEQRRRAPQRVEHRRPRA